MEWLNSIFPNVAKLWPYIVKSLNETLIMVSISGVFAALLGVPHQTFAPQTFARQALLP